MINAGDACLCLGALLIILSVFSALLFWGIGFSMKPPDIDYIAESIEIIDITVKFARIAYLGSWIVNLGLGIGIIFLVMPTEFTLNFSKTAILPLNGFI